MVHAFSSYGVGVFLNDFDIVFWVIAAMYSYLACTFWLIPVVDGISWVVVVVVRVIRVLVNDNCSIMLQSVNVTPKVGL